MKTRRKSIHARLLAVMVVCVLIAALAALPSLAMGMGSSPNGMNGQHDGRGIGGRIVDGVRNGAETVADGVESMVDDLTDIPNGQEPAGDGMMGDPDMADGTNIPDEHIGGAIADNDGDAQPDAQDLDDDNDGTPDKADADADGDGRDDTDESTGMVGIVIAVLVVVAIIILVIAVIPRAKKH